MRFQSISIKNYRQYRGLELEFRPGAHDLQVIIADNGVGKTNLLNAFTWCLYGVEPHLGKSQKQGFGAQMKVEPKLNKEVLLECVEEGRATEDVSVSIDIDCGKDGKANTMRVTRRLPFSIASNGFPFEKKADEQLSVVLMSPGGDQIYDGESAQEFINKYLPVSIREYFFFDGEQLNTYFRETSGEKIREAVYSISQIDLFTTMTERLDRVVRGFKSRGASFSTDAKHFEEQKNAAEASLADAKDSIEVKEGQIRELNNKIDEINDELRGVSDVAKLEDDERELLRARDERAQVLADCNKEFYEFTRNRVIDFYLYPIAQKTLAYIEHMQDDGQLPPPIDPVLLHESLRSGKCVLCGRNLDEEEHDIIIQLLESFSVGSETSNVLSSMTSELQRVIDAVEGYPDERDRFMKRLDEAERTVGTIEDKLKEKSAEVAKYAGRSEAIKELYDRRERYRKQVGELSEQIGMHRNMAKRMQDDIVKYEKKIRNELEKNEKARKYQELSDFGDRALEILRSAEKSVVGETRESMAQRTEELFRQLVWKDSKCERIELSENYLPFLFDKYGFSCASTCSAAERSLLALSFTLAMHEVSGFDSPLFIDTPIARASGENRENFAKTLVRVSEEKQLILAFTPDEYSESIEKEFNPAISTLVHLSLDEEEKHVMDPEVEYRG